MRNELYDINTLIFNEGRVLVPQNIRLELIERLHIGHQGINSIKNNTKQRFLFLFFFFLWSGMGTQLQKKRDQC